MNIHEQIKAQIKDHIEQHGRSMLGVHDDIPFVYSVGNHLVNIPEVILLGNFKSEQVFPILNTVSEFLVGNPEVLESPIDRFGNFFFNIPDWPFPFMAHWCSESVKSEYTIQAGQYLGTEDYRVLQILLCDPAGVFPGQEGCMSGFDMELL